MFPSKTCGRSKQSFTFTTATAKPRETSVRLSLGFFSQKKATDPARFTNRGGNLLKEEKQRSELHKSLPKVKSRRQSLMSPRLTPV